MVGILDGRYQAGFCVCLAAYLSSKFKLAFVRAHLDVDIDFFLFVGVGIKAARVCSSQLCVPLETSRLYAQGRRISNGPALIYRPYRIFRLVLFPVVHPEL